MTDQLDGTNPPDTDVDSVDSPTVDKMDPEVQPPVTATDDEDTEPTEGDAEPVAPPMKLTD